MTTDGGHESFESPDGKLLYYEDYGVKGLRSLSTENSPGPREGTVVLGSVRPGYWAVAEKGIYFVELDDKSAAPQVAYYYFNVGTARQHPVPHQVLRFSNAPDHSDWRDRKGSHSRLSWLFGYLGRSLYGLVASRSRRI